MATLPYHKTEGGGQYKARKNTNAGLSCGLSSLGDNNIVSIYDWEIALHRVATALKAAA